MNKFGAIRTNGYASKKEATRAHHLQLMARAGVISDLREQVRYELVGKQEGERPVSYVADFVYQNPQGQTVVEDVKGYKTPIYVLKRKLMLLVHGIRIVEV